MTAVYKEKEEWNKENLEDGDKKNSNFVMFFKHKMPYLRAMSLKDPHAFNLFLFLTENMDTKNAVMCSMKVLEEYYGVTRQTISGRIKTLINEGLISVFKSGTSNVYSVNPDLVWSSWANGKQYCKFTTNVILSLSEQELTPIQHKKTKEIIIKKLQ